MFAAMQPYRIERAVIDGVSDAPHYYRGKRLTNLQDTDIILDEFSVYRTNASLDKRALYTQGGPLIIKGKFENTVQSLKGNTIGVPAQGCLAPEPITHSYLKWAIREAVYAPIQLFLSLATHLSDLSNRKETSSATSKQGHSSIHCPPCHCRSVARHAPDCAGPANRQGERSTAVPCTDGNGSCSMTKEAYSEYAASSNR